MTTMTPRGLVLLEAVRRNFALLVELEKVAPGDVAAIISAMVAHVRGWRPMALVAVDGSEAP